MTYIIHTEICGPWENYSHIIEDTESKKAIVIDPAWDSQRILERIENHGLSIEAILLTHSHHDHVNGIFKLQDLYFKKYSKKVPVYLHRAEINWIFSKIESHQMPYPTAESSSEQYNFLYPFGLIPKNTLALEDNETMSLGTTTIKIIHTPGHSLGSCCFLLENDLITGDTIFIGCVGRTDLEGSNPRDMVKSLRKITNIVPHHVILRTGHAYGDKPTSTLSQELLENPYLKEI